MVRNGLGVSLFGSNISSRLAVPASQRNFAVAVSLCRLGVFPSAVLFAMFSSPSSNAISEKSSSVSNST